MCVIGRAWQHKHENILNQVHMYRSCTLLREVDEKELESLVYALGQLCCWTNATLIPH